MKERVEFMVFDQNGDDQDRASPQKIDLLWPVQLEFSKRHLLVRMTVLERDLSTAFSGRRVWGNGKKEKDEAGLLKELFQGIGSGGVGWNRLDLNKAIKDLWDKDDIDGKQVRFKKAHSVSTEDMDENCLLKKSNPTLYKELISKSLHGCVFLFLKNQEQFGRGFYCHPTDGFFRFTRYCRGVESTDHVLRAVLNRNF